MVKSNVHFIQKHPNVQISWSKMICFFFQKHLKTQQKELCSTRFPGQNQSLKNEKKRVLY